MADKLALIGDRIIHMVETGTIREADFERSIHERVAFAKAHIDGFYVVIYDLSAARLGFLNVQMFKWSAEIDPNLMHAVVISRELIVRVGVSALSKASNAMLSIYETLERGK